MLLVRDSTWANAPGQIEWCQAGPVIKRSSDQAMRKRLCLSEWFAVVAVGA